MNLLARDEGSGYENGMKLRPATWADEELLFAWRDDPESRANSLSEHTPEIYRRRLEGWFADPQCRLLIAEVGGRPVGTVRIDPNGELNWCVSPSERGKGYGKEMVALVAKPGHFAQIKAFNSASQKVAIACGFRLVSDGSLQEWRKD